MGRSYAANGPYTLCYEVMILHNTAQTLHNTLRTLRNTPRILRNTLLTLCNTLRIFCNTPRSLHNTPRTLHIVSNLKIWITKWTTTRPRNLYKPKKPLPPYGRGLMNILSTRKTVSEEINTIPISTLMRKVNIKKKFKNRWKSCTTICDLESGAV